MKLININNFNDLIKYSYTKFKYSTFIKDLENKKKDYKYDEIFNFRNLLHVFFIKNNVKFNDRVAVIYDNSSFLAKLYLTVIGTFRVFVPINPNAGNEEIKYILKLTKCKILVIDRNYLNKINNIKIKKVIINDYRQFEKSIEIFSNSNVNFEKDIKKLKKKNLDHQDAQILFTSGSTGNPKGVVTSHKNITHNLKGIINRLKFNSKSKNFLCITPIFHNSGQTQVLLPFTLGGTTLPVPPLTSLNNFFYFIRKFKINYTLVMPTHINYLYLKKNKFKKSSLKFIYCGGAKLDKIIQKNFEKKFHTKIYCNYGLTETSSVCVSEGPGKNLSKLGSVGKELFNNKIFIKKKNTTDRYGEILVRGENVFKNYLNNNSETKKKLKKNILHTGDLGFRDKSGFIYIVDRTDNMINVSGENVYPFEIERHVNLINNIKLSVVFGFKDSITQNILVLVYESENMKKVEKSKIINKLTKKISKFKIPKLIFHVSELQLKEIPKAPNKKIRRAELVNHFNFLVKKSKILL